MRLVVTGTVVSVGPKDSNHLGVRITGDAFGSGDVEYTNPTGRHLADFAAVYGQLGGVRITFETGHDSTPAWDELRGLLLDLIDPLVETGYGRTREQAMLVSAIRDGHVPPWASADTSAADVMAMLRAMPGVYGDTLMDLVHRAIEYTSQKAEAERGPSFWYDGGTVRADSCFAIDWRSRADHSAVDHAVGSAFAGTVRLVCKVQNGMLHVSRVEWLGPAGEAVEYLNSIHPDLVRAWNKHVGAAEPEQETPYPHMTLQGIASELQARASLFGTGYEAPWLRRAADSLRRVWEGPPTPPDAVSTPLVDGRPSCCDDARCYNTSLTVFDGGWDFQGIRIAHCPFCGAKLPEVKP